MSYDSSQLDEPLNYVRLLIGDTSSDAATEHFTDDELNHFIAQEANSYFAAARAAEVLAAKFAGGVKSKSADGKSISYDRAGDFSALAKSLRASARRATPGKPYAGGISKSDKELVEANSDRDAPAIELGLHDKQGTETSPLEAGPLP